MNNKHETLDELKYNAFAAPAVIVIVSIGAMIYMVLRCSVRKVRASYETKIP